MRSDAGRRARLIGSPGLRALTFAAGAVLTVLVVDAELTTHVHHSTAGYLILGLGVAWSFLLAGLLAWVRRPANRIGPLMCGVGLTWLCNGLSDSPHNILLTFSLVVSSLWLGMLVHLLLAYPTGRLGTLDARLGTLQDGVYQALFLSSSRVLGGGADGRVTSWVTDVAAARELVCRVAGTPITPDEWKQYVPGTVYDPPCA